MTLKCHLVNIDIQKTNKIWWNNQYKCRIYGNTFKTKSSFMNHRKGEHHEEVKECVNHKNGMCRFNERCWYIHSDDTEMSFSEYWYTKDG